MLNNKSLEFSVDSQLLGELGEHLVTRNYIALSELVKNAYDADATNIVIRFLNSKKGDTKAGNGEIELNDNGLGMTFQEVKDYWMRIATPYKNREPISPTYGRKKTGNKGIGRFACRRLAKKLIFETTATIPGTHEVEWTEVTFEWKDFVPGTTLTEIPCEYQTKRLSKGNPGLKLRLIGLLEAWKEGEFNLLRRQLLTLSIAKGMRRKGFKEDPGFNIRFEAPEFPKGEGILVDQFMDAGWGKLEGHVEEDGTCDLKLTAKEIGTKKYELPQKFKLLRRVKFEIAWVPIKKEYLRDTKTLTKSLAQEVMLEQGGIRVYLDGFRVYPYGDPGDDWLSIDQDVARRQGAADPIFDTIASTLRVESGRAMLHHPRNSALIGRLYISSEDSMPFEVKADREGFVKNDAFDALVKSIRLALQWMVLHYNKFLLIHATEILRDAERNFRKKIEDVRDEKGEIAQLSTKIVDKAVDVLSTEARRVFETLPDKEKGQSAERVEAATEVIKSSFSRAETYLSMLRAVASTGGFIFGFAHEIKVVIARLSTHANTINRLIGKMPPREKSEFINFANSLRETRDRFDKQIELFELLVMKTKDHERKDISLKETVAEVCSGFSYLIKHYGLDINKDDIPDSLKIGPMLDAEAFSIIVNLISNAIKATLAGNGSNISIQGKKDGDKKIIRVLDDGIGIHDKYREEVFQPLTADPDGRLYKGLRNKVQDEELVALGRGSGLGLSIVQGIVESYGGTVRFVDTKPPWKTCVEVVIP